MGDWNGDGLETAGTFEGGVFKLRSANTTGTAPDTAFTFGDPRGFPVAGDFDGDGTDDVAVYRNGTWQVRLSTGTTLPSFTFGSGSWPATVPVAGDWDADGDDTVAVKTGATWSLRNANGPGAADKSFAYGLANDPAAELAQALAGMGRFLSTAIHTRGGSVA